MISRSLIVLGRRGGGKRTTPAMEAGVEKAEVGFEPTNHGFAIRSLRPLGYSAGGYRVYRLDAGRPSIGFREKRVSAER